MKKVIERIIRDYGSDVTVVYEDEHIVTRAFLQLVTSKSWQNMERMIPSGGQVKRGQFLYIGPPDVSLHDAVRLECGGRRFRVRRGDAILYRNEPMFIWGLCVEGGV